MKSIFSFRFLLIAALFIFFISCKKNNVSDNDFPTVPDHTPDLSTKVNSTVSGFVTDENNVPLFGASVKLGTASTYTNQYGYFEIKNVQVVQEAAVVTVEHPGYFRGIKTYIAEAAKAAYFRIKLLPKTIAGTIDASAGGSVPVSSGLNISFPAAAIKDASTGAAYSGAMNVAVQWLDPTSAELNNIMPGDLRGITTNNFLRILRSFGMTAVELTGSGGELLQIADGKKATISMPLPASISSGAPATIPLWYFDENNGLWKEEGTATKTGSTYVGDVSHFSWWNCDQPANYVYANCTIVTAGGLPVAYTAVRMTAISSNEPGMTGSSRTDYTNSAGYITGIIPANSEMRMEVFSTTNNCLGAVLFSHDFNTTNLNVSLGSISVGPGVTTQVAATISGTVTNCNNTPVQNGYIYLNDAPDNSFYPIVNGSYSFTRLLCSSNPNLTIILIAQNNDSLSQSDPIIINISPGTTTIPVFHTCNSQQGNGISNGYVYHPSAPRALVNLQKTIEQYNATSVLCPLGDQGAAGYIAVLDIDAVTNRIIVSPAPGAAGAPYYQWDAGLPTISPGPAYTPQWIGSPQCNNSYDPISHTYYLRYGYIGGTGYRVIEEIIDVL